MSGQKTMQGGGRGNDRDQRSRESFATRNIPKEEVKRRTSKKKGGAGEKQGQGGDGQGGGQSGEQGTMGVAQGAGNSGGAQDPGSTGEAPTGRRTEGETSRRPGEEQGRGNAGDASAHHPGEESGKVSLTELAAATESHHWQQASPGGHGRAHEPQREGFDRRELVRRNAPPITRMSRFDHRGQRPDKRRAHGE